MTLPDEKILSLLKKNFVVGWKNIEREGFCGSSSGYGRMHTAVGTTNGAGGSNVQLFVLSPDRVVLHALPGFWHPDDLESELHFALTVDRLWRDSTRSRDDKDAMFARLHRLEAKRQSELTTARSKWQSFDERTELRRISKSGPRDTVEYDEQGNPRVKPLNVLMRERMSQLPFVPFAEFDITSFVDYGRKHYDNNQGHDNGKRFTTLERLMAKRQRDAAREMRKQARLAKKASS